MRLITALASAFIGDCEFGSAPALTLGSGFMPEYRAYFIDLDGHFHSSVALECADDIEAAEKAKQLVDSHDVELWQRDRKIARFEKLPK